jgi:hypothetical protein
MNIIRPFHIRHLTSMGLKRHRKWAGSRKRAHTSHTERRGDVAATRRSRSDANRTDRPVLQCNTCVSAPASLRRQSCRSQFLSGAPQRSSSRPSKRFAARPSTPCQNRNPGDADYFGDSASCSNHRSPEGRLRGALHRSPRFCDAALAASTRFVLTR